MQPDARRRADTLSWFEKAHKDLRCAQIDLAALRQYPRTRCTIASKQQKRH